MKNKYLQYFTISLFCHLEHKKGDEIFVEPLSLVTVAIQR